MEAEGHLDVNHQLWNSNLGSGMLRESAPSRGLEFSSLCSQSRPWCYGTHLQSLIACLWQHPLPVTGRWMSWCFCLCTPRWLEVVNLVTAKDNLWSESKRSTHYFTVRMFKMYIKVITHQTFPLGTLLFLRPKDCALPSINISCHSSVPFSPIITLDHSQKT